MKDRNVEKVSTQSFPAQPGALIEWCNNSSIPVVVCIEGESGTRVEATLHPGATINVTAGREGLKCYLQSGPEYAGLSLVGQHGMALVDNGDDGHDGTPG